jgi:hypothetical protein
MSASDAIKQTKKNMVQEEPDRTSEMLRNGEQANHNNGQFELRLQNELEQFRLCLQDELDKFSVRLEDELERKYKLQ